MRRKWNLVFVLAGLLSLTLVPAAVADEGHAHADKKEVSPSHQAKENLHTAGKEGKGHGHMEMKMTSPARGGMGGHRAEAKEEKGPGHMEMKGTAAGHPAKEGHHAEGKEEKEHGHGAAEMMNGLTPLQANGLRLVSDLHCNACHYISEALEHGEGHGGGHGGVAPTLGFVGDKFRPDWLFDFIQKPHTIRPWLAIRMPQFRLTEEEAVSLVKHLTEDMKNPEPLPELKFAVSPAERGTLLVSGKKLMSLLVSGKKLRKEEKKGPCPRIISTAGTATSRAIRSRTAPGRIGRPTSRSPRAVCARSGSPSGSGIPRS